MNFKISNQSKKEDAEEMLTKYQFKHKLTKIPIAAATLFLAIALAIAMFTQLSTPLTVHADSMTEQESPGASEWGGTGLTYENTGWLFYLINPDGTPVEGTLVRAVLSYDKKPVDGNGNQIANIQLISSLSGSVTYSASTVGTDAPWGPPFDTNGNYRGEDVRQWLKADSNTEIGHVRAYDVIKTFWDEDLAEQWDDKDVYLVFEPFYWCRFFKNGVSTGSWLCTTSSRWGIWMNVLSVNAAGDEGRGDSIINKYTNNIFAGCVTLSDAPENKAMGLNTPASISRDDRLPNTSLYTGYSGRQLTGYGLGIVWSDKESQTSTYDEPLTTPAPAPDDKEELPYIDQITEGKYANIVKFYEEHHLDTEGNLIEEDTIRAAYTRTPTPRTITIEDEEPVGYTVKEWFTSPTYRRGTLPQNVSIQHLTSF